MKKLKLHGFNNLTKSLSFCIYDICYAKTREERDGYIAYIDELYNANHLTEILSGHAPLSARTSLNIARRDYEPGAPASRFLVSEEPVDPKLIDQTEHPDPLPETVVAHLDKSHIHCIPIRESHPDGRRAMHFRADIEVSTCGCDFLTAKRLQLPDPPARVRYVTIDCARGFTRDVNGMKHFYRS